MSQEIFTARKQQVQNLFEVWSSADIDKAVPFITEDFRLIDHAMNETCQGLSALKVFFAGAADWSDTYFKLTEFYQAETENVIAGLWVLTATHSKTGKSISVPGMSTFQFDAGKIQEENDYYSANAVVEATKE